jgi:hypothetical protein
MRSDARRNDATVTDPDPLSKPRVRLPRWQIVALVVGFAIVQVLLTIGQARYDAQRRVVGTRRQDTNNAQFAATTKCLGGLLNVIVVAPGKPQSTPQQFKTAVMRDCAALLNH